MRKKTIHTLNQNLLEAVNEGIDIPMNNASNIHAYR